MWVEMRETWDSHWLHFVSLSRGHFIHTCIYIYDVCVCAVQTSSSKAQSTFVPPCLHPLNQSSCSYIYTAILRRHRRRGVIYYRHHCPNTCMALLTHLSKYPNVTAETATLKVAEMAAWVKGRIDGGMYLNANVL